MSWGHSKYPGRSRLSVALDELSNAISSCPDSGTINVMTFAHDSRNSFSCLPTISKLTPAIRAQLLACLSRMYGSGGTIPWKQINAVFNSPAKELIILSDGAVYPSDHVARNTWTHIYYGIYFRTPEWSTRFGHLPSLYIDYNKGPRHRNPLLIRAVSLDLDFCTGQRQASRNWLGFILWKLQAHVTMNIFLFFLFLFSPLSALGNPLFNFELNRKCTQCALNDFVSVNSNFTGSYLANSNLRSCNLSGSIFDNSTFENVLLDECSLQNTSFKNVDLLTTSLKQADIAGADFLGASVLPANFFIG